MTWRQVEGGLFVFSGVEKADMGSNPQVQGYGFTLPCQGESAWERKFLRNGFAERDTSASARACHRHPGLRASLRPVTDRRLLQIKDPDRSRRLGDVEPTEKLAIHGMGQRDADFHIVGGSSVFVDEDRREVIPVG